jgi:hypothetical protein
MDLFPVLVRVDAVGSNDSVRSSFKWFSLQSPLKVHVAADSRNQSPESDLQNQEHLVGETRRSIAFFHCRPMNLGYTNMACLL